ncbi:hypothetical protein ARMGADRAFT_12165 [Armillaria gallica]|uniref:C2H2-type domain-containing protein n=1 Tax=Armillaria gallica TaxID=47427 RepID=A0A2H3EB13_ARMGA|nr:hypothetical protein ARMGADRAFT_12165 [Armillaria gallica]
MHALITKQNGMQHLCVHSPVVEVPSREASISRAIYALITKKPGCGRAFAQQHDCKRHEKLHSNNRPFSCEPCGKMFDRMDALNRHLRSEGGAECARVLEGRALGGGSGTAPPVANTDIREKANAQTH